MGGINDSSGHGVIENTELETGINTLGTLTVNTAVDCSYNGYIRNGDFASVAASTGLLALVKSGSGKLTLTGANCSDFTGGLTIMAGTLDFSGATSLPATPSQYDGSSGATGPTPPATLAPCPYTIGGGTLQIGSLSASIGAFRITYGTVSGSGTLTSNGTYLVSGGQVDVVLAGSSCGLTKSGKGGATLNGNNTYGGDNLDLRWPAQRQQSRGQRQQFRHRNRIQSDLYRRDVAVHRWPEQHLQSFD